MNNFKNPTECTICTIFHDFDRLFEAYPDISGNNSATDGTTLSINYNALRAEMIEGLTRVANARNWGMLSFFAALSVIFNLHANIDYKLLLLSCSSIIIGLLSHFAAVAYKDIWDLGAHLLAFEVKHEKHFSNEHHSWLYFMDIPKNDSLAFLLTRYGIRLEAIRTYIASNNLSTMSDIRVISNPNSPILRRRFISFTTDFYLWLSCFTLAITIYLFCELCCSQQVDYFTFFLCSVVLQLISVLFVGYFIWFERVAFRFAFLESMIKYVRMNRGLNLQIRYNWLYRIFA